MTQPGREPLPAPRRETVTDGVKVVRKPIFQSTVGLGQWVLEMVNRIILAKSLGFTAFEIDVQPVMEKIERPDQRQILTHLFDMSGAIAQVVLEGEEWKGDSARYEMRSSFVITVYALVVE